MSCYLNIYLVPKKEKVEKNEPLLLYFFSRNSDVYHIVTESINVPFCANKITYKDLTLDDMSHIISGHKGIIDDAKRRLQSLYNLYSKNANSELQEDILSSENYIVELEESLQTLIHIKDIVEMCDGLSDFEKVVVNQG